MIPPKNFGSIKTLQAVLETKFDNLESYMREEFIDMKMRQDRTNGNVGDNKRNIDLLQKKWSMLAGGWVVICILVLPLVIRVFGKI